MPIPKLERILRDRLITNIKRLKSEMPTNKTSFEVYFDVPLFNRNEGAMIEVCVVGPPRFNIGNLFYTLLPEQSRYTYTLPNGKKRVARSRLYFVEQERDFRRFLEGLNRNPAEYNALRFELSKMKDNS